MAYAEVRQGKGSDGVYAPILRRNEARVESLPGLHQLSIGIETAYVGNKVFKRLAAQDSTLRPFVEFDKQKNEPAAFVSALARVDSNAVVLEKARILDGAKVGPFTVVGYCAYIMEGAELEGKSIVGNFATVGEGAKIGERVTLKEFSYVGANTTKGPDETVYAYGLSSVYPWSLGL